jgi:hypothetical protein
VFQEEEKCFSVSEFPADKQITTFFFFVKKLDWIVSLGLKEERKRKKKKRRGGD